MTAPLTWIQRIAMEVPELNEIPLFGNAPPFDWTSFASQLAALFETAHLHIDPRKQQWQEEDQITKGLGTDLFTLPITVSPLGSVLWIMPCADVGKLTGALMKPSGKMGPVSSELLQEGFYRYLALEALLIAQNMRPFEQLTLQISEEEPPIAKAFCIDVEIQFDGKSCWGRLVITTEFRTAWVQHFSHMSSQYVSQDLGKQIELALSIKTGSISLTQDTWNQANVGDFLLLDQEIAPTLMLGNTALFSMKIAHNQIELTDYAFYHEENMAPNEESDREITALKEVPVSITVEIARFKMTLDKLMHLTPGNTIELPVHPDQSVSLSVNGQKVGRGELIHLGDQLGVRILEI